MAVPTLISELSTTAASNAPAGADSPSTLDDIQRAHAAFIAQLRDNTGFTTAKASSGANSDITSLTGLTTALSIAQGGSGSATAFANLMSLQGYQKLPNGLVIQWGNVAGAAANTQYTASFPIAFPTACLGIVCSTAITTGSPVGSAAAIISSTQYTYSVGGNGYAIHWLAVGY